MTQTPISILSNFKRVFEKIIYNRSTSYIKRHELLYSLQHGFRKGHSTQHAILDIVNDIQTNMNLVETRAQAKCDILKWPISGKKIAI